MIQEKNVEHHLIQLKHVTLKIQKRSIFMGKKARKKAFNKRRPRRRRCPRNRCSMSKCNKLVYRCVGNYLEM